MDRVLANLESLRKAANPDVDTYLTVVGGLSGLNYLSAIRPKQILFFDINLHAFEYLRLILELIAISGSPREFISRVFCRSVDEFLRQAGQKDLTVENQRLYLAQKPQQNLFQDTIARLSDKSVAAYRTYVMPHLPGRTLEGIRNCRVLLPCFDIHQRVPVGGGQDRGYNEQKQLVPNTNSFFYGYGWLGGINDFLRVKELLHKTHIEFLPIDLVNGETDILAEFSRRVAVHLSNIDDWFSQGWKKRAEELFCRSIRRQGKLTLITTNHGVQSAPANPHQSAFEAIRPYVTGSVVEVTHKTPWGFHEFDRKNVLYLDYLKQDFPADTTIVHILVGEGLSPDIFMAVCHRALRQSSRILVLEHNQDSADWTDKQKNTMFSAQQAYSVLTQLAEKSGAVLTAAAPVAGSLDLRRNMLFVLDGVKAPENCGTETIAEQAHTPAGREAMPCVSVYIAAYNTERYISSAIESVLAQTFRDFELIIIDDGSGDRTVDVVRSYQDSRIRFYRQEHKNFAAVMNRAIQLARGQYVIGVDSDDAIEPDYLEQLVRFAQAHPHCDYYYPAALKLVDTQKRYAQDRWEYKNFEDSRILPMFLFINGFSPIPNSGSLKRRAMFEKTGLYRDLSVVADFDFLTRNALKIRFKRVDGAAGYHYRIHDGNSSTHTTQRHQITAEAIMTMTKLYTPETLYPSLQSLSGMEKEAKYRRFIQGVFQNLAARHAGRGGEAFERRAAMCRSLSEMSDLKTKNSFENDVSSVL
jgi:GT2 family glycosyltransferase